MNHDPSSPHRPSGPDLLRMARQTFETALLPALGGEQRYTALMVRHALAICEREWTAGPERDGDAPATACRQAPRRDAGREDDAPSEAAWAALMHAVNARLAVDAGEDPGTNP